MIPNNNLSVLPWYTSIEQQNARKWWINGRIYPLFVTQQILPFQVSREHIEPTTIDISVDGDEYNCPMQPTSTPPGELQRYRWNNNQNAVACLKDVTHYRGRVINITIPQSSTTQGQEYLLQLAFVKKLPVNDQIVQFADGTTRVTYSTQTFSVEVPIDAVYLYYLKSNTVQGVERDFTPTSMSVVLGGLDINYFQIYRKDGTLYRDDSAYMRNVIYNKTVEGRDYFIYNKATVEGYTPIDIGQYYAVMSDGINTWYSEVFTVIEDMEGYLKIEWWDREDFIMDAGAIIYKYNVPNNPSALQFKNELYLQSDLAKPEYVFDEEDENRDGYIFPIKQISEKRYRFKFFASEYLLDAIRLIRLADYIKITYRGQEYNPDSFLITPQWEENGDVASVEGEFDTATVAKKLGSGYVISE